MVQLIYIATHLVSMVIEMFGYLKKKGEIICLLENEDINDVVSVILMLQVKLSRKINT